jgi:hypothetical protein
VQEILQHVWQASQHPATFIFKELNCHSSSPKKIAETDITIKINNGHNQFCAGKTRFFRYTEKSKYSSHHILK